MSRPLTRTNCKHCGAYRHDGTRWRGALGFCGPCYERWRARGRPSDGVPAYRKIMDPEGHREDLRLLLAAGVTNREELARRVGVTRDSIYRYLREMREA